MLPLRTFDSNPLICNQSSVGQAFTVENGWPYGAIRDDDAVIEKEKQIGDEHPVRKVRTRRTWREHS